MISRRFGMGLSQCLQKGRDPSLVPTHYYGNKLYVWNWKEHELIQEIDTGMRV